MKRLILAVAITFALAVVPVSTSSALAGPTLQGSFRVHFPKGHPHSNAPCPADAFCGVGSLAGAGAATITILDETFEPMDNGCFAVTRLEEIDLVSGSGSVVLDESGTFCRPGRSGDSHANPFSYGAPGQFKFTYVATSQTGELRGTPHAGTIRMRVAGGVGVWHLG